MLERFTGNFSSLLRREPIAKCGLEIAQRHIVALSINETQQRSYCLGDVVARRSQTGRNHFCDKNNPQPFQPISNLLPSRPHVHCKHASSWKASRQQSSPFLIVLVLEIEPVSFRLRLGA